MKINEIITETLTNEEVEVSLYGDAEKGYLPFHSFGHSDGREGAIEE